MKIPLPDKLNLGQVNINLIRSKFDSLIYMRDRNVDIFFINFNYLCFRYQFLLTQHIFIFHSSFKYLFYIPGMKVYSYLVIVSFYVDFV